MAPLMMRRIWMMAAQKRKTARTQMPRDLSLSAANTSVVHLLPASLVVFSFFRLPILGGRFRQYDNRVIFEQNLGEFELILQILTQ